MGKTFILATDGSENARSAEEYVLRTLDPERHSIVVVVASDLRLFLQIQKWKHSEKEDLERDFALSAEEVAQQTAERIRKAGFEVDYEVLYSAAGEGICDVAESINADGIFLGRKGLAKMKEVLIGSVSRYVVHHAPCPVTVVPPD